ncbi:7684_t:CDS:1, partial [Gigaspora margarita]
FDKALEQYNIKFIKQYLTFGSLNLANLKQKIMAIQDEYERLLLFYNEFVEDNKINIENHKVKQYTKAL